MSFFTISKHFADSSADENSVDYEDEYPPYQEEYDGDLPTGLSGSGMYYPEMMQNDDINYEDDGGANDYINPEPNFAPILPEETSQPPHHTAAAPKKSFFGGGGGASSKNVTSNRTSSFFGQASKTAAPKTPTPPSSYISSDSSCESNDSLVLSGESAEEPLPAVSINTPVRGSILSPAPPQPQRTNKVAKQLFFSPATVSSGETSSNKPIKASSAAAPAKTTAPARTSTTPPFLSNTAPKFVAAKFSTTSFSSFGSASKKTAPGTGSTKPPLSSAHPSQSAAKPKSKATGNQPARGKSVTFQSTAEPATAASHRADVTPAAAGTARAEQALTPQSDAAVAPRSVEFSPERHSSSPTQTVSVASVVPATPVPGSSSMAMETVHLVTPSTTSATHITDATTDSSMLTQRLQWSDDNDNHNSNNTAAVVITPTKGWDESVHAERSSPLSPAATSVPATDSAQQLHTSLSSSSALPLSTPSQPLLDATQALNLCEQMDQQAEELQDRLRRARDTVRDSRAAMVLQILSAARMQSQYLVEDTVSSAAPKLVELQRKMEQLRFRFKAIESAREQVREPAQAE